MVRKKAVLKVCLTFVSIYVLEQEHGEPYIYI